MRRLIVALVVILCIAGILGIVHDRRNTAEFHSITPERSEQQVRAAMGAPSQVDNSCSAYGTHLSPNCDHVLVYRSAFSFLTQKHWLVFMDNSGHVTATSMQIEP